ncbi:MAG: ribose 5-phosphate isomerase A [Thermoleophilia bacterium]|nr:ribose 5-phosphate isomerase A [Thermoleophilia bacterium]
MANTREAAWAAAGAACANLVEDGMRVGLGTGRAATAAIVALGARVRSEGLRVVGVPTSPRSAELAVTAGLTMGVLDDPLDLAFDGADAIDARGLCVKGAGGAMVRERIVAMSAPRFIVLVDPPKMVASLDEWGILPIAVVPFAANTVIRALGTFAPTRRDSLSDDGLVLLDLRLPPRSDWAAVADEIRRVPGVIDHGLFRLVLADVFIGHPDGSVATAA